LSPNLAKLTVHNCYEQEKSKKAQICAGLIISFYILFFSYATNIATIVKTYAFARVGSQHLFQQLVDKSLLCII